MRRAIVLILVLILVVFPLAYAGPAVEKVENIGKDTVSAAVKLFAAIMVLLFAASIILLVIFVGKLLTGQKVWGVRDLWTWVMVVGIIAFSFYIIGYFAEGEGGNLGEQLVFTLARGLKDVVNKGISAMLQGK